LIDRRVKNGNERVDMTDKRVMKKILGYKKFVSGIKRTHAGFHLITILLLVQSAGAQQLIFNGSFEDVNICDEYQAPCSPSAWFYMNKTGSIGYSRQGELGAKEQNRYLRLLVVRYDTLTRQYWETSLAAKMEVGKRYKASFRIFDENGPNLNDIGFYFGNSFILSWQDSLLQPENYIAFTDAKPKRLKNGWYLIEKEFVATTNGEVLIIGNFSGLSNTEILRNRNLIGRKLYIALDDLSIVCLEANAVSTDPLKKDSLYGLTRRHYILPPKPAAKGKANPLKIPVIVDDIEPKIDTIRLSNIEFAFNKHTLKNVSILESYRSQFTRNDIDHINVIGFTDSSGTQKYNNELSIKRAGEIARLIQSRFGIGAAVIKYEGRGESVQYKDDSMNRRVEIFIYYK